MTVLTLAPWAVRQQGLYGQRNQGNYIHCLKYLGHIRFLNQRLA